MTVVTRWWWIRHAKVDNPERRLYGQNDVKAITDDPAPYARLAPSLPGDAVWLSSHLSRTRDTAAALKPHMVALGHAVPEPLAHADLAEQDFGAWQGLNIQDLKAQLGEDFDILWRDPGGAEPPGGESFAQVIERVGRTITLFSRQHAGRDIIAFAHGGSIRAALAVALKLEPSAALSFQIRNLSLTRIDHLVPGDPPAMGLRNPWQVHQVNHLHPDDD
ncbi:MAG: histidine phosphatase family protein [Alphaproteobacteria bacterium]|nr:histidine phosphatase family protein [Alphaproteobacteria bacterium]